MKKAIFIYLLFMFTGQAVLADGGKSKHRNSGKKIHKASAPHGKRTCPNKPGCICY